MPGPVSDVNQGPKGDMPYVPSWCYENGPRMCKCGCHEGYHGDNGSCIRGRKCGCKGFAEQPPKESGV
jgi:hypothetical protein